eukprot:EG_transcript_34942
MAALQNASSTLPLPFPGLVPNVLPLQTDVDTNALPLPPLPPLDPNQYLLPPTGDFFPLFPNPLTPHLLEQRMYSVREICGHYGLKCSADGTKEGWRFRDRTCSALLSSFLLLPGFFLRNCRQGGRALSTSIGCLSEHWENRLHNGNIL